MKVCVLIISAPKGKLSRWDYEKSVWKRYMHKHPHVDCYFLESHKEKQCVENDTIYTTCEDSITNGILVKTLTALDLLKDKYDYYVRTNLSTFMVLDRLYKISCTLPTDHLVYTGRIIHNDSFMIRDPDRKRHRQLCFIGGTSIFLNNLATHFLLSKVYTLSQNFHDLPDDVVIGYAFQDNGVHVFPTKHFPELYFWDNSKSVTSNLEFIENNKLVYIRTKDMRNKKNDTEIMLNFYYPNVNKVE